MADGPARGGYSCRTNCVDLLRKNLLVTLTLVGVGIGFIIGFAVAPFKPNPSALMWIGMAGELYIRMLKMMIVPLVVCSIVTGAAAMDPRSNGRISGVSLAYILITNTVPAVMGTIMCLLIKPGAGVENDDADLFDKRVMETEDIFADLLRNVVPDNVVSACFQQAQTKYEYKTVDVVKNNGTNISKEKTHQLVKKYIGAADSSNILGLIIVSAIFGVGASSMADKGRPFLDFFRSSCDVIIRVLRVLIWSTPVGVASLIAKTIAGTADIEDTFRKLGLYFVTTMAGLIIYGFILIPLVYYIVRRKNPYRFLATIIPPFMIAFATGSTTIALPESFNSLEHKNGIDRRISRIVAPFSATIGRGGSAMYISVSCIFIMQSIQVGMDFVNVFLVIVLTAIFTLAIPSVTGASLVTVLILLTALNIPGETAAMLFALEFFLDRSRTVVNLITQLTGVVVTHVLCFTSLPPLQETQYDVVEKPGNEIIEKSQRTENRDGMEISEFDATEPFLDQKTADRTSVDLAVKI